MCSLSYKKDIMIKKYLILVLHLYLGSVCESARILAVFPSPFQSHHIVFQPYVKGLIDHGHKVVVITMFPEYSKRDGSDNLIEIDIQKLTHETWYKELSKFSTEGSNDLISQAKLGLHLTLKLSEIQFKSDVVRNIVEDDSTEFDLIITEAFSLAPLMLSHRIKKPIIQISSFGASYGNYESVGAPVQPLIYPELFQQKILNLSIFDEISELYTDFFIRQIRNLDHHVTNKLIHEIYDDAPNMNVLINNIDMLLLNTHAVWDENRPVPQSVVFTYGLHRDQSGNVPQDLQSYLDSSPNGVIYVSFGTNVVSSLLPPEKIQVMLKVFSELPYKVLWKWDSDEMPGRSGNVKIGKWFPQANLLKHPNIKLFITQAGLHSTDEAIAAEVPVIGMPILFDQFINAEKYVRHGIGKKMDLMSLSEKEFKHAVTTVIEDNSYRRNIAKLRRILYDLPQSPLQRAIWWTEHVLRHGGAIHLRAPSANMDWTDFYEVELLTILLTVLFSLIYSIWIIFKFILLRCIRSLF